MSHPVEPRGTASPFKRKTLIRLSQQTLVSSTYLDGCGQCPQVVKPLVDGLDLAEWARGNTGFIDDNLNQHGAILFRGFRPTDVAGFQAFVTTTSGAALDYTERSSPRTQVQGAIYTSTDHPPEYPIFLHNEQSYNISFPTRIFFQCVVASETGGQTPIADTRAVLKRISSATRERFERDGYMYVRNFGDGLGLSWQDAFRTKDPAAVEAYCRNNAIAWEWKPGGRLKTWQVRRVIARHPQTGELTWFNHATFFNVTTLDERLQHQLREGFGDSAFPNQTCYGDGSPIPDPVMQELRDAYLAEKKTFNWQQGDVLMLDNLLCAHAREPFSGARKVVVGMARPCAWPDV
ncbi:TauD/TfdA family dioxygenase [Xanthomonas arboricola]|uniref:TauD/TfdA family dioxygenase n=1 Tax=Xanthomonas arboricola TaxID=56448 RepID=UPI00057E03E6|nr:TauD/TfdA family dioxygenase [Xanthomonas arboricola]